MTPSLRVRPYQRSDRAAVRELCWQTAYLGGPPDFMYADRASWVDLFTRYFTDREPECSFVACDGEGRVVGYLLGCVDARREESYRGLQVLKHFLLRGVFLRRGTAGFWWRAFRDALRGDRGAPAPDRARFPAAFHIDLLPEARGTGAAHRLLAAFLAKLSTFGVPGCHADVLANNGRVRAFLERHGFTVEGPPFAVPGMRAPDGGRLRGMRVVRPSTPLPSSSDPAVPRER